MDTITTFKPNLEKKKRQHFFRKKEHQSLLVLGASLLALFLHTLYYYPYFADDSFISLRYSARLIEGLGLTWTEGIPVEGYSNLLWVLMTAFLGYLGIDLVLGARILGFFCSALIPLAIHQWHRYKGFQNFTAYCITLFTFSFCAPIAAWTLAGLEQPLYAGLLALCLPLTAKIIEREKITKKNIINLSFLLGLICITRPDGPLFSVIAFISLVMGRYIEFNSLKKGLSPLFFFLLPLFPVLFYFGQLAFRLYYYGEFVPNTALVKSGLTAHHYLHGFLYLGSGFVSLAPVSLVSSLFIFWALVKSNRKSIFYSLALILVIWSFYIMSIGGDNFQAHRHFLPLIPVFLFGLYEFLIWYFKMQENRKLFYTTIQKITISFSVLVFLGLQFLYPENVKAKEELWEWDGQVLGLFLKDAFEKQQPLVAVTAAGCIPYYSELPVLDMLGLNDYYLPRHPPESFGTGYVGHELGDGQYVLDNNPDVIIFHFISDELMFVGGEQLSKMPLFHKRYQVVSVKGKRPFEFEGYMRFNKYSKKIGIRRDGNQLQVPAYLFASNIRFENPAYLSENGKPTTLIPAKGKVSLSIDSLYDYPHQLVTLSHTIPKVESNIYWKGESLKIELQSSSDQAIELKDLILVLD